VGDFLYNWKKVDNGLVYKVTADKFRTPSLDALYTFNRFPFEFIAPTQTLHDFV